MKEPKIESEAKPINPEIKITRDRVDEFLGREAKRKMEPFKEGLMGERESELLVMESLTTAVKLVQEQVADFKLDEDPTTKKRTLFVKNKIDGKFIFSTDNKIAIDWFFTCLHYRGEAKFLK